MSTSTRSRRGRFPANMTEFAIGDEAGRARAAKTVPAGRVGRAEDFAGTMLYLAGRAGAYTTGAVMPLDGGMSVAARPTDVRGRSGHLAGNPPSGSPTHSRQALGCRRPFDGTWRAGTSSSERRAGKSSFCNCCAASRGGKAALDAGRRVLRTSS